MYRISPPAAAAAVTLCRYALIAAGTAVLVAACGLQKGPHQLRASNRNHEVDVQTTACSRADVRMRLDPRSARVAAGTSYIPLDVTNFSPAGCRLAGYPVVTLANGPAGHRIGAAVTFDRHSATGPLVLPSGHTAHTWLSVADVADLPARLCKPVRAAGFRVRLPGRHRTSFVRHRVTTCANRLRGTVIMTVEPFRLGRAKPGAAQ